MSKLPEISLLGAGMMLMDFSSAAETSKTNRQRERHRAERCPQLTNKGDGRGCPKRDSEAGCARASGKRRARGRHDDRSEAQISKASKGEFFKSYTSSNTPSRAAGEALAFTAFVDPLAFRCEVEQQ